MRQPRSGFLALLAVFGALSATGPAGAQTSRQPAAGDAGMVVTGDREAPQVLTIIPWQEPAATESSPLPAATGLPPVLDDERPLAEEPLSKPLPGPAQGRGR